MMRAELKRLHYPDMDIESFWPDDPECFHFLMQAMIGPEGTDTEESFDFEVSTPKWLLQHRASQCAVFGHHMILAFDYDLKAIEARVRSLCSRTTGETWEQIASKLSQFGRWEFEDYRP
ncbi:immunity 8 family protein [Prosthecobacter dejongeii]|uniref:Immunity protein 8 n=1 Tax=Prosthecobacter dejongeii TaxID=48465 RepID=A0A7W8DNJ9_9BACT|nr:immunity 8 family protein [Prosthecobacter dejongeii]MBB5036170.1 hypothetical protein [Prosthecobacter dejongeii]